MERIAVNRSRKRPGLWTLVALLGLYLALALSQGLGSPAADERRPLGAGSALVSISGARS